MADELPTVESLLGPRPAAELPTVESLLGPPPDIDRQKLQDNVDDTAVGRILDGFGQGAANGWGSGPLRPDFELGGEGTKYLSSVSNSFRLFNEKILKPIAGVLDYSQRAMSAVAMSGIEGGGQFLYEIGAADSPHQGARRANEVMEFVTVGSMGSAGAPIRFRPRVRGDANPRILERAEEAGVLRDEPDVPKIPADTSQPMLPGLEETPVAIAPGSTIKDMAGNINLSRIGASEDVKNVIRETAERRVAVIGESSPFIDARRGVQTWATTRELADKLGMTPEDLLKRQKGEAWNAERIYAARNLLAQSEVALQELARKARGGSDQAMLDLDEGLARHVTIQEGVQEQNAALAAEAGRALNQYKMISGQPAMDVKALIERAGGRDKLEAIAEAIANANDPSTIGKLAREARKATTMDKIREIWINGLLSAPTTHEANMLGNLLVMAGRIPEHYGAAIAGLRHGGEKVSFREANAVVFGLAQGSRDILTSLWRSAKNRELDKGRGSEPLRALVTGEPSDAASKIDVAQHRAISGTKGEVFRIPGRLLITEDEIFKSINYRASINALAVREARKAGLDGKEFRDRVAELRKNPTDKMSKKAAEEALYFTLQSPLGEAAQYLMRMRAANKATRTIGGFVAPFIRIAVNITKYGLGERSPLGALAAFGDGPLGKALRGELGKAQQDLAIARMTIATTVGIGITSLAAEGFITGSAPADPIERGQFYGSGKIPYAIKIGDKYHTYDRYGPHGLLIGVWADMVNMGDAVETGEADKIWATSMATVSNSLIDKNWLAGPSQLMAAINEPERYGDRYARQFLGSFVPGIVNQTAREIDPVMRDTRTVTDQLLSRVPWASRLVAPKRDVFGEVMEREGSAFAVGNVSTARLDLVVEELTAVGIWPAQLDRSISGVELTPRQYDEFQAVAGRLMKITLDQEVTSKEYAELLPFEKKDRLSGIITWSRDKARAYMKMKYPQILEDAIELKTAPMLAQ